MDDPFQINIVLLFGVGNKQRDPVPLRLRRQISFLSTHTHTQSHRHWNMDLQAVQHTYNNEHTQTDKNMDTHVLTCSLILIANTHNQTHCWSDGSLIVQLVRMRSGNRALQVKGQLHPRRLTSSTKC